MAYCSKSFDNAEQRYCLILREVQGTTCVAGPSRSEPTMLPSKKLPLMVLQGAGETHSSLVGRTPVIFLHSCEQGNTKWTPCLAGSVHLSVAARCSTG